MRSRTRWCADRSRATSSESGLASVPASAVPAEERRDVEVLELVLRPATNLERRVRPGPGGRGSRDVVGLPVTNRDGRGHALELGLAGGLALAHHPHAAGDLDRHLRLRPSYLALARSVEARRDDGD